MRIRRLRSEDRARYIEFLGTLEPADLYLRMMGVPVTPEAARIDALLAVDGESAVALAAVAPEGAILGVVRAAVDAATASAEFALIVRSRLERRGLGTALLRALLPRLSARGVRQVFGHTFAHNEAVLRFARGAGSRVGSGEDGTTRSVRLARSAEAAGARG